MMWPIHAEVYDVKLLSLLSDLGGFVCQMNSTEFLDMITRLGGHVSTEHSKSECSGSSSKLYKSGVTSYVYWVSMVNVSNWIF